MKLAAWLLALSAGATADTLVRYSGVCHVESLINEQSGEMTAFDAPCVVEDMSDKANFNNRYRVLLMTRQAISLPTIADYVRVQNVLEGGSGSLRIASLLWGSVTIKATDPAIRAAVERQLWAYETRPQNLTVRRLDDETVEVYVVEFHEDLAGGVGSPTWEIRHQESMRAIGRAK